LNQSTRFLLRLVGIQYTGQGWYNRVTPEELRLIVTTERESIGLEAEERELLCNVFEFGEVLAVEVMTPRTSITAIPLTATFAELIEEVAKTGHSRYPVQGDSLDDIHGIIDFKDLAKPWSAGQLRPTTPIQPWLKTIRFESESTPISELLPLMQRSRHKMVMIFDEHGGTSGLVTLQDVIDEIIGQTAEGTNSEEVAWQMLDDQTFLVQAQINLEELNELLELNLPLIDEYQTLAGFLLYQFQKIPTQGETFHYDNLEFTVVSSEGPKLNQIRIHRRDISLEEEEETLPLVQEGELPEASSTDTSGSDEENPQP
jgi:CBS domain containing-hemolysin-like protein